MKKNKSTVCFLIASILFFITSFLEFFREERITWIVLTYLSLGILYLILSIQSGKGKKDSENTEK